MDESAVRFLGALACGAPPEDHGVLDQPLDGLLETAGALGLVSLLTDHVAAVDHPERKRAVAISLLLAAQRERLFDLLTYLVETGGSGAPILVKGGALIVGGYLEHRDMVDLDVVVPVSAVPTWKKAAASIGADWKQGAGYEAGAISCEDGIIEVHTALPGFAGSDAGPGYEELASHVESSPMPDILVPRPTAAREITVQHFAFHHAGDVGHALRVLQDLASLEGKPEGDGLDWGRSGIATCTARLREIVRQIRDGCDHDPPANEYLTALEGAWRLDSQLTFAEEAGRWVEDRRSVGGKLALVFRRLFPPIEQVRVRPDERLVRTLPRYLTRPFRLLGKLAGPKRQSDPGVRRWREVVEKLKA